jgi:hypothetical protein
MEIAEKLATLGTQDDDKQSENTTQCILHKNTNNVNKGKNKITEHRAILQRERQNS